MRRISVLVFVMSLVMVAMAASVAFAASPHFKKGGTPKCTDTGTQLVCTGALAGLGNGDVTFDLSADALGTFACVNPSTKNEPLGQNKVFFPIQDVTTIPGSEIKNGNLAFRLVGPDEPPTATAEQAGCPGDNWSTRLADLEFSDVTLKISQGDTLLFTCTKQGALVEGTTYTLSCQKNF